MKFSLPTLNAALCGGAYDLLLHSQNNRLVGTLRSPRLPEQSFTDDTYARLLHRIEANLGLPAPMYEPDIDKSDFKDKSVFELALRDGVQVHIHRGDFNPLETIVNEKNYSRILKNWPKALHLFAAYKGVTSDTSLFAGKPGDDSYLREHISLDNAGANCVATLLRDKVHVFWQAYFQKMNDFG